MYFITYNNKIKKYATKPEALRNAAKLSKELKCVTKVYSPEGQFIKSFDWR